MLALEEEACGVDGSAAVIFVVAICVGMTMLVPVYFMQSCSYECCCIGCMMRMADDFCVGDFFRKMLRIVRLLSSSLFVFFSTKVVRLDSISRKDYW